MRSNSYTAIAGSTGSSLTSAPIPVSQMTQFSVIVSVTGDVTAAGTVTIQASNDVGTGFPVTESTPSPWVTLPGVSAAVSGNGQVLIPITNVAYQYIRVVYTRSAGSGGVIVCTVDTTGPSPGLGFWPGGDLGGTVTSQTVIGIQGNPVASTAPSAGEVLTWSGTEWAPAAGGGGGTIAFNANADDADSLFLVHGTGSIVDDGFWSLPVTVSGSASLAVPPVLPPSGDATALFSSSGASVKVNSSNVVLGTSDFTIEFCFRVASYGINQTGDFGCQPFDMRNVGSSTGIAVLLYNLVNPTYAGKLVFYANGVSGSEIYSPAISLDTWHYVAICRSGSTTTMWFDGASCGTTSLVPANLDSQVISIMGQQDTSNLRVDGYMSEARVYKASLYSGSTISIPSAPYTDGVDAAEFPPTPADGDLLVTTNAIYACTDSVGPTWKRTLLSVF